MFLYSRNITFFSGQLDTLEAEYVIRVVNHMVSLIRQNNIIIMSIRSPVEFLRNNIL